MIQKFTIAKDILAIILSEPTQSFQSKLFDIFQILKIFSTIFNNIIADFHLFFLE